MNYRLLFLLTLLIGPTAFAQVFPDYKERAFSGTADSVLSAQTYQASGMEATDGVLDEQEFIVGPGDKIFISISGVQELIYNLPINHEGFLYLPKVGGIDLRNRNLAEAKQSILNAINKYYKNVDVFISLAEVRRIKVALLGEVNKPATYNLPANARLIDLISHSAGFTRASDFRTIKIISVNGTENFYDFLKFLRFGDKSNNPYLKEGDRVIISKIDKTISVMGAVMYPGTYEFVDGETISGLIELSGGFITRAKKDTIELVRFDEKGQKHQSYYYSVDALKQSDIELRYQDRIIVREIPDFLVDRYVRIDGYVKFPGYYKIIENRTLLSEIIKEAGGFRIDASLSEAKLIRSEGTDIEDPEFDRLKILLRADMTDDEYDYFKARSRQRTGRVVVDFIRLFEENDKSEDVILKRGDVISIPEAKNYVIMLGQVLNPGKIVFREGLTVDDYITLAGGFGWRALKRDVRVIKANTGEWIDADDVEELEPGDTIWVPEDPPGPKFWDVFTTSLTIVGQVASIIAATVAIIVASR